MIGQTISHYKIVEKLGQGGMGVVFKAQDTLLDRFVTLKFISSHLQGEEEHKQRLITEARAASAVEHPNVCSIYEIAETDEGQLYIVMAYYSGQTLRELIQQGPLEPEKALEISTQILAGLERAFVKGIIHRDIKPENIMLTEHGEVKILDFGLAKLRGESNNLTTPGSTLGTCAYMSPEQIQGLPADQRSDLFAVGVLLYEMLSGHQPFCGDYFQAVLYAILNEEPEPIDSAPPGLETIMTRALQKEPEARYQTPAEMLHDLQQLRAGSVSNIELSSATHTKILPGITRRKKWLLPLSLLLALLLVGGLPLLVDGINFWRYVFSIPKEKHLAVLTFSDIGNNRESRTICDGLLETLSSKLGQLEQYHGQLWVVPASEVRGQKIDNLTAAREKLGVNLAVNGSLQQFADSWRLTLNLVDTDTRRQLNSTVIDQPMTNLPLLQDEAVLRVTEMLRLQLEPETRALLAAGHTSTPDAYQNYLKGRGLLLRFDKPENLDDAIRQFEQAVLADPNYALAHAGLGEAYLLKFRESKEPSWLKLAQKSCRKAQTQNPELAAVHITLGLIEIETGHYEKAVTEYLTALKLDPNNASAYNGLARAYQARGELKKAEETCLQTIRLKPDYWSAYNSLGTFYLKQGRYREAVDQFRRVVELTPGNVKGYINLGSAYFYLEDHQQAINAFTQALAIEPKYSLFANLATLYFYNRRYEEAARTYEKALEIQDNDYKVWDYLAVAYERSGADPQKYLDANLQAIRLAEQQRQINARDAELLTNLAEYYNRIGKREKAISLLREAGNLNPGQMLVVFDIGLIYEELQSRDEALKWIKKAIDLGYPVDDALANPGLSGLRSDASFMEWLQSKRIKQKD